MPQNLLNRRARFFGRKNNRNAQASYQQPTWGSAPNHQQPTWNSAPRTQQTNASTPLQTIDITPTESHSTGGRVNGADAKSVADKYRNL